MSGDALDPPASVGVVVSGPGPLEPGLGDKLRLPGSRCVSACPVFLGPGCGSEDASDPPVSVSMTVSRPDPPVPGLGYRLRLPALIGTG